MATNITTKEALAVLRQNYQRKVHEVAERVRPLLAGVREGDGDELTEPAALLERECKATACPTEDDARLCWALSPNWEREVEICSYHDMCDGVAVVVAHDVAAEIGADWYVAYNSPPAERKEVA